MIYAKTGMETFPEHCGKCDLHSVVGNYDVPRGWVYKCDVTYSENPNDVRMDDCPLTEIDETKEASDDCRKD